MVSLSTKIDKNGFWFLIKVSEDCPFKLSYVVMGSGGRQSSGEISGVAYKTEEWIFQAIDFPVFRVGITDLAIASSSPAPPIVSQAYQDPDSFSRRQAIKTFASAVLAGSALILLPTNSGAETLGVGAETGSRETSYNPYFDESAQSYNPYFDASKEPYNPY